MFFTDRLRTCETHPFLFWPSLWWTLQTFQMGYFICTLVSRSLQGKVWVLYNVFLELYDDCSCFICKTKKGAKISVHWSKIQKVTNFFMPPRKATMYLHSKWLILDKMEACEKGQMSKAPKGSSFHTFHLVQAISALPRSIPNKQTPYFTKGLNVDKTKDDQWWTKPHCVRYILHIVFNVFHLFRWKTLPQRAHSHIRCTATEASL